MLLPNIFEPREKGFTMRAFIDSNHTGNSITCHSRTIFLNSAPIYWYSHKYSSYETSSFSSQIIAIKTYCEYICRL